jgi:hypothetical protein
MPRRVIGHRRARRRVIGTLIRPARFLNRAIRRPHHNPLEDDLDLAVLARSLDLRREDLAEKVSRRGRRAPLTSRSA